MFQKHFLFLIITFFSFSVKAQLSDTCNTYSFQKLYTLPSGTAGKLYDLVENADGTIVSVGEVSGSALIMKTTHEGNVVWSKKIAGSATDKFQHIKQTSDGGYLAMGVTNSFGGYYLVKFTSAGALNWAHSFPESTINNVSDAVQTSDGGYAIIMQGGLPPIGLITVVRLDNNANTLWNKQYKVNNGIFVTASWPGGILEENDSLVISGAVEDTLTGQPGYQYHTLSKISKSDGSVYWAKRWLGGGWFSGMLKYNNYYYVEHQANGYTVTSKVDINGNISKTFYLTDALNNTSQSNANRTIPTHDNGFLITRSKAVPNVVKIGANDSIQWANQYLIASSAFSFFNTVKEASNFQVIAGGGTTGATAGILLSRISLNGAIGNCPVNPFTTSEDNVAVVSHPFTWTWIHSDPITNTTVFPTSTDINFTITNICSTVVYCDSLKISGADTACVASDTITYTAHKNPSCPSIVQFQVAPSSGTILSTTDSTARIVFTQMGTVKVFATMTNTCGIVRDSIRVNVSGCSAIGDSCGHHFYQKLYGLAGCRQSDISDFVENPDGTTILAGYVDNTTPFTSEHIAALIMKVKRNGDVIWVKKIGGNWRDKFQRVRKTLDGNYIAIGVSDSYLGIIVVKFDGSGNIIWSRSLMDIQYLNTSVDVVPLSDGNYAISMGSSNFSAAHFKILKLNATGNTIWYKSFNTLINSALTTSRPGGLIEENDSLVFTALCRDPSDPFLYFHTLTKISKASGNIFWSKRWAGGTEFTHLLKMNNNYYTAQKLNTQNIITKLDLNGNIITSFYLSDILNIPFLPIDVIGVTSNNELLISRINSTQLNLAKVGSSGLVQWSNQYAATNIPGSFTAIQELVNNDILAAGNVFGSKVVIARLTPNGIISGCQPTPFSSSEITVPMTSEYFTWTLLSELAIFNDSINPPIVNVDYSVTTLCSSVLTCDSLKLTGIDSACMTSDTIIYIAHRGANCFSPIQFLIDPTHGNIISHTDTTAKIVFTQAGTAKIYASISNSCGLLKDSISVNVFASPPPVNLGPDFTLCSGASRTLHAGPGFRTYQWQDGSTDSNLIVSAAGLYFVKATNYCGAVYRDSINVLLAAPQVLHIGNDTSKCNTDILTFTATGGFTSYSWSPNYNISAVSGQSVNVWPAIDTLYKLTATTSLGCTNKDSIRISVYHSTSVNLGNDTSLCSGNSLQLNAGPGFTSYLWNTGATTQQVNADSAKPYIVTATNIHHCISRDTLNILFVYSNPTVHLRKDSTLCIGSTFLLDAGTGFTNYQWQDGSAARTYTVNSIGKYWVMVTDNHLCKGSDTTYMKVLFPLPANFIYSDTAICEAQSITLKASIQFPGYLWSTNATTSQITISSAGTYWLQVTNSSGCSAKENINVTPKNCIKAVYFPNAFTPNRDGKNDVFKASVFGALLNFHLFIYNRYGEKMFETRDFSKGWNGSFQGQPLDAGTFVWYCEYQFSNEIPKKQKGVIVLFR